eukprot:3941190-Rhodomonas_salina.1
MERECASCEERVVGTEAWCVRQDAVLVPGGLRCVSTSCVQPYACQYQLAPGSSIRYIITGYPLAVPDIP